MSSSTVYQGIDWFKVYAHLYDSSGVTSFVTALKNNVGNFFLKKGASFTEHNQRSVLSNEDVNTFTGVMNFFFKCSAKKHF